MNRSALLTVFAFSFSFAAAAGCAASPASETAAASADDTAPAAALTQIVDTTAGKVLADAQGLSLYRFDPDTTTTSNCNDACAVSWPPLLAPTDADAGALAAPFGEIARNDGKMQITFDGHPLYRYKGDRQQGDVKGDGLGHVWHLARPLAASDAGGGN
jgi:predicted lipoprotein with Yx(FWY)xxD motif